MKKEFRNGLKIILLIALLQFFPLYFGSEIYSWIGFGSAFTADLFYFLMNATTTAIAAYLARRFCPIAFQKASSRIAEMRKRPFVTFSGFKKYLVAFSVCMLFVGMSSGLMRLQTKVLGVAGASFEPATSYLSPTITQPGAEDIQFSKLKKAVGIFAASAGEELLYRWFLFHLLLGFISTEIGAVVVSSILFGLMHFMARSHEPALMEKFVLICPAIVAGFGFSAQFLKVGLFTAIILHFSANFMSAFKEESISSVVAYVFAFFALVVLPSFLISAGLRRLFRRPI